MTTHTATYSPEDDKIRLYLGYRLSAEEYAPVKAAGYRSAPKQGCVFAFWSPAAEDIALELAGEIDDEDKSLVERAEERADRFEDYQENRTRDAEAAHRAVKQIADGIPFGQPILVGHHSERHARRDAEKIENGMRRAVKMWDTAQYWKSRAAGALAHAKYKERPDVRARRIKTIEADKRKQERNLEHAQTRLKLWSKPLTPEQARYIAGRTSTTDYETYNALAAEPPRITPEDAAARVIEQTNAYIPTCQRWLDHYANRIAYERAMLDEVGGTVADQKGPEVGGGCKCWASPRNGFSYIKKVNKVSVTVEDNWGNGGRNFTRTIPFDKLAAILTRSEVEEKRAAGLLIDSADGTGFFITDSRSEAKPEPTAEPEPAPAADFQAMRESLRAGVQTVAAPQLFPTPADLARRMVELADIRPDSRILEPSAGTGSIIKELLAADVQPAQITAIELNTRCAELLRARFRDVQTRCTDFLETADERGYDLVLMNPPFENGTDIKHIRHALTMLRPGGRLVAICANGARQQDQLQPLADSWEELPTGTFEGTQVRAALLVIDKDECSHLDTQTDTEPAYVSDVAQPKETTEQAERRLVATAQDISLKESKCFDTERLNESPLFQRRLF